jgi:hypothetical protein
LNRVFEPRAPDVGEDPRLQDNRYEGSVFHGNGRLASATHAASQSQTVAQSQTIT